MTADIPEDDLSGTRAALAPTLAATESVLPWLNKQRPPRFAAALNQRWITACHELREIWSAHVNSASPQLRPAVFTVYGLALESNDADCLALGEALASATDRLENGSPTAHLRAAMSAAIECIDDANGLEHEAFSQRAQHFAARLLTALEQPADQLRSPLIDRLFAAEVSERLSLMREALDVLPPDAVMLKSEAAQIAEQAELIELYGVMDLARQLDALIDGKCDLERSATRSAISEILEHLAAAIAMLDAP